MPPCKQDCKKQRKICNETTGRCIEKNGKVAQRVFGKRDCKEDCELVGKVCNKTTGNCNKVKLVKKKPVSPPKPKIDKELEMFLDIEGYFERADVQVLSLDKLKKFREEIISKSKIRESRLVVDWSSLTKAFKSVGKKMGVDVKKFDEATRDFILIRMTLEELKEKVVLY
jgi:hypothetical protein